MKSVFLILSFLFSIMSFAKSSDPQWNKLLKYKKGIFSSKSEVLNDSFFITKDGNHNPQNEYNESLSILKSWKNDYEKFKNFICTFPARSQYINQKEKLNIKLDFSICEKYSYFLRKIRPESVSLVFASFFVNNPSSIFGHTFLKINAKGKLASNDLLHWGANFSANMTTNNPILYGIYGITGGFSANYSLLPYYLKVTEYSDSESRELWEYKVNLTDEQLNFLMAHLYEMDQAIFSYYYFNGNCSSQLIELLDVVFPNLNLANELTTFVIPTQTIRILERNKIIKDINFRPSNYQKVVGRKELLTYEDKQYFSQIQKDLSVLENEKNLNEKSVELIDSLIDYIDYKFPAKLRSEEKNNIKNLKNKLLTVRANQEKSTKKLEFNSTAPHLSHPERKVSLGYGKSYSENIIRFDYRFAMHDLLDGDQGYPKTSGQEMGNLSTYYLTEQKKIHLNHFYLVNVENNPSIFGFEKNKSWALKLGLINFKETRKNELSPFVSHAIGLNLSPHDQNILTTRLRYRLTRDSSLKNSIRVDLLPEILLGIRLMEKIKIQSSIGYDYVLGKSNKSFMFLNLGAQLQLNKNHGVRIHYNSYDNNESFDAIYSHYF